MHRPPIACRRAVQSLQNPTPHHVWVTDDLLSVAVNRFFRIPCPHQKRHGSHVPGPLEARRRAAKRRMTASANFHPQDNLPPLFSLGALFGLSKQPQPSWKYEPPWSPRDLESLVAAPDAASLRPPLGKDGNDTIVPPAATHISEETIVRQSADEVSDTACFELFKAKVVYAGDLSHVDQKRLLAKAFRVARPSRSDSWRYNLMVIKYVVMRRWDPSHIITKTADFAIPPTFTTESMELLNCLDELSAYLPLGYLGFFHLHLQIANAAARARFTREYMDQQDVEVLHVIRQLWSSASMRGAVVEQSVTDVLSAVASKIQNARVRKPLRSMLLRLDELEHRIMVLIMRAAENDSLYSPATRVLDCLPPARLRSVLQSITSTLTRDVIYNTRFSKDVYNHRLTVWLELLADLGGYAASTPLGAKLLDKAVAQIQRRLFVGRDLIHNRADLFLSIVVVQLSTRNAAYASSKQSLLRLINEFTTSNGTHQVSSAGFPETLGAIFVQIQKQSLPYEELFAQVITHLARHVSLKFVLRFLTFMDLENVAIHDTSKLRNVFKRKASSFDQLQAPLTARDHQHLAYEIDVSQKIVRILNRLSSRADKVIPSDMDRSLSLLKSRYQFEHILKHAQAVHALPLLYRAIESKASDQVRAALIHQLAHQYSLDGSRSYQELWRTISHVCRYIQENNLPMGPLLTRAIVRCCIIRPMTENRFVSSRRLIWVCQLVAKVEGENEAKKIESIFWDWRGELLKHAKTAHVDVGGHHGDQPHLNTMKRLGLV